MTEGESAHPTEEGRHPLVQRHTDRTAGPRELRRDRDGDCFGVSGIGHLRLGVKVMQKSRDQGRVGVLVLHEEGQLI